jgi:hypothetical protein
MTLEAGSKQGRRISAELTAILERLQKDPAGRTPPTLAELRSEVEQAGVQWSANGELLYPQDRTSLLIELDDLIQEYGEAAPAMDLINV